MAFKEITDDRRKKNRIKNEEKISAIIEKIEPAKKEARIEYKSKKDVHNKIIELYKKLTSPEIELDQIISDLKEALYDKPNFRTQVSGSGSYITPKDRDFIFNQDTETYTHTKDKKISDSHRQEKWVKKVNNIFRRIEPMVVGQVAKHTLLGNEQAIKKYFLPPEYFQSGLFKKPLAEKIEIPEFFIKEIYYKVAVETTTVRSFDPLWITCSVGILFKLVENGLKINIHGPIPISEISKDLIIDTITEIVINEEYTNSYSTDEMTFHNPNPHWKPTTSWLKDDLL